MQKQGLEQILEIMEPKINQCIKKYAYKIDKMYTYEDLFQEGYATVILALKEWDGINKRTSLTSFIWMRLEWAFKTLAEKSFENLYKTKFIEDFERELSETDFDQSLSNYFKIQTTPETQLLEALTPSVQKDEHGENALNILNLIYEYLPKRLQQYVSVLKDDELFSPEEIAKQLGCTVQNIVVLKKDLTNFIKNFEVAK